MGSFCKIKQPSGQSSIEVAIVLGMLALIIVAMTRSWVWSNSNMVGKLQYYKDTRLKAGKSDSAGEWHYSDVPKSELKIFK